jgi:DNA repair protein RadA/Sms
LPFHPQPGGDDLSKKVIFACCECGYESPRWLGRCPECGKFNTLAESARLERGSAPRVGASPSQVVQLADDSQSVPERLPVGIGEFSRVLGGGLVPGSVILLAGDPGIGKSTLLLQLALSFAGEAPVLYLSAEESVHQVHSRARRLGAIPPTLLAAAETELGEIERHIIANRPALAIIDSIQTVYDAELPAAPGSIVQVRQCAGRLIRLAKETNLPLIMVGHVTKEGVIAGPRLLEHMVDAVLYLEGERHLGYRILRGQKNRFGSIDEVGIFEMGEKGLSEVQDPSGLFISQYKPGICGTALAAALEGSRPLLVEVQGLLGSAAGPPRRTCSGPDYNRLLLILAVLEKQLRLPVAASDVFVNIPGGLHIAEPALDLALALSLVSAQRNQPLPPGTICLGEIGLTGEVRPVSRIERRLAEAGRLGLKRALIPAQSAIRDSASRMEIITVENIKQAGQIALLAS